MVSQTAKSCCQNISLTGVSSLPKTCSVALYSQCRPRSRTSVDTPASPSRSAATAPPNPDPMTIARCVSEIP